MNVRKVKIKSELVIFVLVTVLIGFLSSVLAGNSREIYDNIINPPFSPEGYVFGYVWTILYILMGISAYNIYEKREEIHEIQYKKAMALFCIQLFLNFIWSIIFFRFNNYFLSLVDIILLDIFVFLTIREFEEISELSAWLLIPYFVWILFATYLNIGVFLLN